MSKPRTDRPMPEPRAEPGSERARKRVPDLTPELVARVPPFIGPAPELPPGQARASPATHQARLAALLAARPAPLADLPGTWVFAYGSLIWKPCFAFTHEIHAQAPGWHRAFCLGWMQAFRGSVRHPGLMMALDRGGSCHGVAYRLPDDALAENLAALLQREMPFERPGMQARWMQLRTAHGPLRALGFTMDRRSPAYVSGLTEAQIAASLATSAGEGGSMAEYLLSTVQHLHERGIHDSYLWHMQQAVARLLQAMPPPRSAPGVPAPQISAP